MRGGPKARRGDLNRCCNVDSYNSPVGFAEILPFYRLFGCSRSLRSLGMMPRKCHSERSEESILQCKQLLRRQSAPQNDSPIFNYSLFIGRSSLSGRLEYATARLLRGRDREAEKKYPALFPHKPPFLTGRRIAESTLPR